MAIHGQVPHRPGRTPRLAGSWFLMSLVLVAVAAGFTLVKARDAVRLQTQGQTAVTEIVAVQATRFDDTVEVLYRTGPVGRHVQVKHLETTPVVGDRLNVLYVPDHPSTVIAADASPWRVDDLLFPFATVITLVMAAASYSNWRDARQ